MGWVKPDGQPCKILADERNSRLGRNFVAQSVRGVGCFTTGVCSMRLISKRASGPGEVLPSAGKRSWIEVLEERRLLAAPVIDAISNVTVPSGKSLIVPVTASDADSDTLTYSVSSSSANVTASVHTGNPFLK